jgi:hypothetical protein
LSRSIRTIVHHRWPAQIPQSDAEERRSKIRFPLELPITFRIMSRRYSAEGAGRVVNISSGGLLVEYPHYIPAGVRLEVNIDVPVLLDGRVPLQISAVGRVLRCEAFRFAVSIMQHQFRTKAHPTDVLRNELGSEKKSATKAHGSSILWRPSVQTGRL